MSEKKTESAPVQDPKPTEAELAKAKSDLINAERDELKKKLAAANAQVESLSAEAASLRLKVNTLEELLVEEAKQSDGDHVILDGERCEITHRMGVRDFFEAIRRHEVPEDQTVVAVNIKA